MDKGMEMVSLGAFVFSGKLVVLQMLSSRIRQRTVFPFPSQLIISLYALKILLILCCHLWLVRSSLTRAPLEWVLMHFMQDDINNLTC